MGEERRHSSTTYLSMIQCPLLKLLQKQGTIGQRYDSDEACFVIPTKPCLPMSWIEDSVSQTDKYVE